MRANLLQRDGPVGRQAQRRRCDPGEREGWQVEIANAVFRDRSHEEGEVKPVIDQLVAQVDRDIYEDIDIDQRHAKTQRLEERRQPSVHDGLGDAEAEQPALLVVALALRHFLGDCHEASRSRQQVMARWRQAHLAIVPLEQAHSELAFKLADPVGNGRLGGVELFCRQPERGQRGNPEEGFNLPNREWNHGVHHFF